MCGIVGVITGFNNGFSWDEANMFRDMLVLDTLRGFDSTGVFGVSNKGNMAMVKDAINGASFVKTKEYSDFSSSITGAGLFAVGHNRAATRGSISDKNAHPFCIDDKIVLVQNGTYKGSHTHLKNTDVDTEAIAHVIAEEDNIEKALKRINAAYALVWHNIQTKTLNIIRNDERPMYITYTKTGGVIFASEREIILMAAARNDIHLNEVPYLIKEGQLVSFQIQDNKSYEMDCKDIDYKFNYQQGHPFRQHDYNNIRTIGPNWNSFLGDDDQEELTPVANAVRHQRNDTTTPDYVKYPLPCFVEDGKFNDFAVNNEIAEVLMKKHGDLPKDQNGYSTKPVMVSFYDYAAVNDHRYCSSFFVFGRSLSVDENEPTALYYCLIRNTTEEDMMSMVYNDIHTVIPSTCYRQVLGKDYNDPNRKHLVTSFCMNPICVVQPETEAVSEQVH